MDKLQELTDKLYNEGLSRGKAEGEQILGEAKKQAEQLIADAKKEAASILAQAQKEAEDLKTKVESDVKMAAGQSIQATKKDVENLITAKLTGESTTKVLASADFVKEIIKAVAAKFTSEGTSDLSLVLPAALQAEIEPFVKGELAQVLGKEVAATFSKKIAGGFTIAPKDGGYYISMTDETFNELISEYLRPVTKKILFG